MIQNIIEQLLVTKDTKRADDMLVVFTINPDFLFIALTCKLVAKTNSPYNNRFVPHPSF